MGTLLTQIPQEATGSLAIIGIAAAAFASGYFWVQAQIAKQVAAAVATLKTEIDALKLRIRYLEHSDRSIRQMMVVCATELIDGAEAETIAKKLMAGATHYDEIKP